MTTMVVPQARPSIDAHNRLWIDGEWKSTTTTETIDVINPATGEVFASIAAATVEDVDAAVASARRSFRQGAWRRLTGAERGRILWRLSDLVERDAEKLAQLDTLDCGMPLTRTRVHLARGVEAIRYYAGMCTKLRGQTSELSSPDVEYHAFTRREPIGVAGLITPWNGPLLVVCNKVAPALAAGCSVVVKPSEDTSLTALAFAELAREAGIPAGVINIVTGTGRVAGAALAAHPDVNKVSFTGSTVVGKDLVRASADNLKRLSLELGGKSPVFVFDDADFELTIPVCFRAIFANSGQVCVAGSRLYVQRASIDRVVSGLRRMAEVVRLGDGMEPSTDLGPLVSERQRNRVMSYIQAGKDEGAELVTGGRIPAMPGYFVEPTIFLNAKSNARVMTEEIFGPVLNIVPFDDLDDVEQLGNATPYGLAAGIFTRDLATAHRAAKLLDVGNVWVNC